MPRSRLLPAVPVLAALVLLGACGSEEATVPAASPAAPSSAPVASSTPPPAGGSAGSDAAAEVSFEDQSGPGDTVTVARVALPAAGFVVVTADDGDDGTDDDRLAGATALPPGVTTDVQVTLDRPLAEDTDLEATLWADTDGDGAFDPSRDQRVAAPGGDDDVSEDADYSVR